MAFSFASSLADQLFNDADVAALIESCDTALNNSTSTPASDFSTNRNTSKSSIDTLIPDESDFVEREGFFAAI